MPARRRSPPQGFTLIESAVALAIVVVLVGSAAPALVRLVAARSLAAQAAQFMSALRFARSEAVKRGEGVTLCARDPAVPTPRCQGSSTADWRSGWIVFADPAG